MATSPHEVCLIVPLPLHLLQPLLLRVASLMLTWTKGWSIPILGSSQILDSQLNISFSFTHLFVNSNKCSREYKTPCKINIFYKVLCVDKSVLLGDSPPKHVECIFWLTIRTRRQDVGGSSPTLQVPSISCGSLCTSALRLAQGPASLTPRWRH
jgi:hypothetical protein